MNLAILGSFQITAIHFQIVESPSKYHLETSANIAARNNSELQYIDLLQSIALQISWSTTPTTSTSMIGSWGWLGIVAQHIWKTIKLGRDDPDYQNNMQIFVILGNVQLSVTEVCPVEFSLLSRPV